MALEALAAGLSRLVPGRVPDDGTLVSARVYAVADGADFGTGAGAQALADLRRLLGPYPSARSLAHALSAVNFALWRRDGGKQELRSTVTAAIWLGSRLIIGHVGDSRAYLVRNGRVYRLTPDQRGLGPSQPGEEGVLQLGHRPPVAVPHVRQYLLNPRDCLMLCTDGLWRLNSDPDFVLAASLPPPVACELLCSRWREDHEEASVVVVAFSEGFRVDKTRAGREQQHRLGAMTLKPTTGQTEQILSAPPKDQPTSG